MSGALPLVQLTPVASSQSGGPVPASAEPARKPSWLKVKAPGGPNYVQVKAMMRELGLHTVCEEARCPNVGECWEHKAATFMILGDVCTRNCTYCAVSHGTPTAFDPLEPVRLAEAVSRMELQHVVITSVDRDDLPNGGAEAFADCISEIRRRLPDTTVEVLIPDFKGFEAALQIVMDALTHRGPFDAPLMPAALKKKPRSPQRRKKGTCRHAPSLARARAGPRIPPRRRPWCRGRG